MALDLSKPSDIFLTATKQLYEWFRQSVCLSVCLSLCSHHHIIIKFSGVTTLDRSDVQAKREGQSSKVKVIEVKTQFSRFRTVASAWIKEADEITHKAWCGIEEVRHCFSRSSVKVTRDKKIADFDLNRVFPNRNSSLNSQMLQNDAQSLK